MLPCPGIGQIEHDQVFRRRRRRDGVEATDGKFEVIVLPGMAQHDAVEAVVIFETTEFLETKTVAVHRDRSRQRTDRPGDANLGVHGVGV